MSWYLHHVNMPSPDVPGTARFLEELVGLRQGRWIYPARPGELHHDPESIAYFGTENRGIHVVRPIPTFAVDNGFLHNPTYGGHFALTVADLRPVTARLREAGVPFTDAGAYAMRGVRQLYLYDPAFNVIEVNAVESPLPAALTGTQDSAAAVRLRAVSIPAFDVERSVRFFRDLIGLGVPEPADDPVAGGFRFRSGPHTVRLSVAAPGAARDAGLAHDPGATPYFAIEVDDLAAVAERLRAGGHVLSAWSPGAETASVLVNGPGLRLMQLLQAA